MKALGLLACAKGHEYFGLASKVPVRVQDCRADRAHGIWMQARQMFEGEMASLEALRNTGLVRVPKPMKVIDLPGGGAVFVMEHLKMKSLSR